MNSKSQLPRVSPHQLPPIFVNKLLLEHSCDFHLGIFSAVWAAETWGTWFSVWLLSKHFTYESQLRYRIFETHASRQRGGRGGGGGRGGELGCGTRQVAREAGPWPYRPCQIRSTDSLELAHSQHTPLSSGSTTRRSRHFTQ